VCAPSLATMPPSCAVFPLLNLPSLRCVASRCCRNEKTIDMLAFRRLQEQEPLLKVATLTAANTPRALTPLSTRAPARHSHQCACPVWLAGRCHCPARVTAAFTGGRVTEGERAAARL